MPTDLRGNNATHTFDVEQPPQSKRKGITRLTVEITPTSSSVAGDRFSTQPSRWRTTEFSLYLLVFSTVVPLMFWIPIQLSSGTCFTRYRRSFLANTCTASHPNFALYSNRLSQGWLFGRRVVSTHFAICGSTSIASLRSATHSESIGTCHAPRVRFTMRNLMKLY